MKKHCVFFGINNSKFSLSFLKELHKHFDEICVVTSKNNALSKKKNIKKIFYVFKYHTIFEIIDLIIVKLLNQKLEDFCRNKNIEYENFDSINNEKSFNYLKKINPQIIFVCSFSELINNKIIGIPRLGIYNFHFGDLPSNQGPNPIQWSVIKRNPLAVVTCHELTEKFDTGDIITKAKLDVANIKNYKKIESYFIEASIVCLNKFIGLHKANAIVPIMQESNKMKYYPKVDAYQKYKLFMRSFLNL